MKQISFLINCSNNTRSHLELLLRSLELNLDGKEHQILVFIDSDNENIHEYLKSIQSNFYDLTIVTHAIKPCVGYAMNSNIMVDLAKHDICAAIQSDMVIGPHYDTQILSELEENCILSATRIEPPLHGISDKTITYDLGTDPIEFDMERWNEMSKYFLKNKTNEYFFAPITFYKKVWQDLGGYDTLFRRSREDSDLVQRAIHLGIKLKQTWKANVYHFTCTSSRGKNWFDKNNAKAQTRVRMQNFADMIELSKFIKRWGSFNHGETKLYKYDVDLIINGSTKLISSAIFSIAPFVSRVWVTSEMSHDLLFKMKEEMDNSINHMANLLFDFSDDGWEYASKFYNERKDLYDIRLGEPSDYNIVIQIDATQVNSEFVNHISSVHQLLNQAEEVNLYQMGNATVTINKKIMISPNSKEELKIKNPEFNLNLLTIE